jgi:signal transduction histidine kinase
MGTDLAARARESLDRASIRAELVLSAVRLFFVLLIAARFFSIDLEAHGPHVVERGLQAVPATLAGAFMSLWVFWRYFRSHVPRRALVFSVLIDAGLCFVGLLSNVVTPFPSYQGALLLPEIACFMIMVVNAGFRVSPKLALIGFVANTIGFYTLTAVDLALNSTIVAYGPDIVVLHSIFILATGFVSVTAARRTERLVLESVELSHHRDRAEVGLKTILADHHDAQGLVLSALLSARQLSSKRDPTALAELEEDLEVLRATLVEIRIRAQSEVVAIDAKKEVDLAAEVRALGAPLGRLVAPVALELDLPDDLVEVALAGGRPAFQRVLMNLLLNSKEGDGTRGATTVTISVASDGARAKLIVEDDGPGIVVLPSSGTTKRQGAGVGLAIVRSVVDASGGTVRIEPRIERGGTRVELTFPRVSLVKSLEQILEPSKDAPGH